MMRLNWSDEQDAFLIANYDLTNQQLALHLGVDASSIKKRYLALGIDRPSGKIPLARARAEFARRKHVGQVPDEWFDLPKTRTDAKIEGTTAYWDGMPCSKSKHISRRKTSSGGCIECELEVQRSRIASDASFRDKRKAEFKKWYESNKEEYLEAQRLKFSQPEWREWFNDYNSRRLNEKIEVKLAKSLRDRVYKAIARGDKSEGTLSLLGCSIEQLKTHLESQFSEGMSWSNYGEWHIDHIRPCASFDLTNEEEQKECFHYTNLQPLWEFENKSKGGLWEGIDPRGNRKPRSNS